MRTDSIFRICSMTKPIVSLAVMMLYEEGRFVWMIRFQSTFRSSATRRCWLRPKGRKPTPFQRPNRSRSGTCLPTLLEPAITGIPSGTFYKEANIASGLLPVDVTIGENVKRLARLPLLFNPGERWNYGLNVDVLGYLIEVVSGKPLDQFLKERIFEPLGMHDTFFYVPQDKLDRLATAYTWYEGKGLSRFPDTPVSRRNLFVLGRLPGPRSEKAFLGRRWSLLHRLGLCPLLPADVE